ncbi:MAG TPA: class I fructose-bisphosphate aldolase [Candidatus Paceibacterota bacterium]
MTLHDMAGHLVRQGKGILAADESNTTCNKRFEALGIPATEEMRRAYREILFTTPGIEEFLSGVILYDETIRQSASDGTLFHELLASRGIQVGIKVDGGLDDTSFSDGQVTKGLDGLAGRLKEYKSMSAVFTKWRMVTKVTDTPQNSALQANVKRMAEYARVAQAEGFVPIIEPEVLIDGDHTAAQCENAIVETLTLAFDVIQKTSVDLKGLILKTSMAVSGKKNSARADAQEVAERTMRALKATVPDSVAGVVFLSGGQKPEEATANLNEIARLEPRAWPLTFSFSRALQEPVLALWMGNDSNRAEAQAAFHKRLSLNILADAGGYSKILEEGAL